MVVVGGSVFKSYIQDYLLKGVLSLYQSYMKNFTSFIQTSHNSIFISWDFFHFVFLATTEGWEAPRV